jgi:hypothetical protein
MTTQIITDGLEGCSMCKLSLLHPQMLSLIMPSKQGTAPSSPISSMAF